MIWLQLYLVHFNHVSLALCCFTELGIDKSIFIKPKTFHLTVLMLKLWNKERVALASEVLQARTFLLNHGYVGYTFVFSILNHLIFNQSISSKVIDALDNRPIFITLKGLVRFCYSFKVALGIYIGAPYGICYQRCKTKILGQKREK